MNLTPKPKPTPPKGGRRGGSVYPRVSLSKAVDYASKLVAKTHTGPQSRDIIGPGVFGAGGSAANERISALRQFGLLSGNDKGYEATPFAKQLVAAAEDKPLLLQQACLKPVLFKKLHQTFVGDSVTKAKIRQQILGLNVHPDSADECLTVTVESMCFCGLWKDAGNETVTIAAGAGVTVSTDLLTESVDEMPEPESGGDEPGSNSAKPHEQQKQIEPPPVSVAPTRTLQPKANLEIKIDPSMDPEKLEKLLSVLRKYGQV